MEYILLGASALLLLSIFLSRASDKLGNPALLIFLVVGMLAGSDGPGGIHFDYLYLAQFLGVVALSFILFAGGLDTNWVSVRPVLWSSIAFSSLTLVILTYGATAVLGGKRISCRIYSWSAYGQ